MMLSISASTRCNLISRMRWLLQLIIYQVSLRTRCSKKSLKLLLWDDCNRKWNPNQVPARTGCSPRWLFAVNDIPSSLAENEIQSSLIKHELQSVAPESQPSLIQHEIQSKLIVVENDSLSASKRIFDMSMIRQSTSPRICEGPQFVYCNSQSSDVSHQ